MIKNPISYPGNKNRLLKQLIPEFPANIETFVDVFCGSGVVGVNTNANTIICNDINSYTLEVLEYFYETPAYEVIRNIEYIIDSYHLTYSRTKEKGFYIEYKHEGLSDYNREGYNQLKDDYNLDHSVQKLVVLLIYGFNHYLRFNKQGEFNIPVGKVDLSKSIYDSLIDFVDGIKHKNICISNLDYREKELYVGDNKFFYFDPPYLITTAPYNNDWSIDNEKALLNLLDWLDSENKKFALSNVLLSNGKENLLLKEWCQKYNTVYMRRQYRNANYQKKNITDSIEVLIKNY